MFRHPSNLLRSFVTVVAMFKSFLATAFLVGSLLFSQGGNLLVAALCPHLQSGMPSCETQSSSAATSHEAMAHEDMGHTGHMEMEHETLTAPDPATPNPDADVPAIDQRRGPCSHCEVHSTRTPISASLRETAAAKRSAHLTIPLPIFRVAPVKVAPVAVLTSRAHGPPGNPTPSHILINIFRI